MPHLEINTAYISVTDVLLLLRSTWTKHLSSQQIPAFETVATQAQYNIKSLNHRQSDIFLKFKESKEHIEFKLWYVD